MIITQKHNNRRIPLESSVGIGSSILTLPSGYGALFDDATLYRVNLVEYNDDGEFTAREIVTIQKSSGDTFAITARAVEPCPYTSNDTTDSQVQGSFPSWSSYVELTLTNEELELLQTTIEEKAQDDEVLKLTGDQTLWWVKTFTSSPEVPTPTNNNQAVNKEYVDNEITLASTVDKFTAKRELGETIYPWKPYFLGWGNENIVDWQSVDIWDPTETQNVTLATSSSYQYILDVSITVTKTWTPNDLYLRNIEQPILTSVIPNFTSSSPVNGYIISASSESSGSTSARKAVDGDENTSWASEAFNSWRLQISLPVAKRVVWFYLENNISSVAYNFNFEWRDTGWSWNIIASYTSSDRNGGTSFDVDSEVLYDEYRINVNDVYWWSQVFVRKFQINTKEPWLIIDETTTNTGSITWTLDLYSRNNGSNNFWTVVVNNINYGFESGKKYLALPNSTQWEEISMDAWPYTCTTDDEQLFSEILTSIDTIDSVKLSFLVDVVGSFPSSLDVKKNGVVTHNITPYTNTGNQLFEFDIVATNGDIISIWTDRFSSSSTEIKNIYLSKRTTLANPILHRNYFDGIELDGGGATSNTLWQEAWYYDISALSLSDGDVYVDATWLTNTVTEIYVWKANGNLLEIKRIDKNYVQNVIWVLVSRNAAWTSSITYTSSSYWMVWIYCDYFWRAIGRVTWNWQIIYDMRHDNSYDSASLLWIPCNEWDNTLSVYCENSNVTMAASIIYFKKI